MVNCAKCGRKLGFFEEKYDYEDKEAKTIKYCSGCNDKWLRGKRERKTKTERELKEQKEKTELAKKLANDKLISQFCKKYVSLCLSLDYPYEKLVANCFDSEIIPSRLHSVVDSYNKILDILLANQLSEFKKIIKFKFDFDLIHLCLKKRDSNPYKTFLFVSHDLLNLLENAEDSLSNFLEIVFDKYGNIDTSILVHSMEKKARDEMGEQLEEMSDNLNTKEMFFTYIQDNCKTFFDGEDIDEDNIVDGYDIDDYNKRYWLKKYMEQFLEIMKKKNIVNFKSLHELKDAVINWKKKNKLKKFEDSLLSPNKLRITIEDTDSMNGFEFEDFLSKLFTNMGYKVKQTKLSGDQGADLIVEKNNKIMVVQAKCYSNKVSNKAIQEVVGSIKHYKADSGMVITNHYFTPSAIKLASSNDIRLIDRNKLKELIELYINK